MQTLLRTGTRVDPEKVETEFARIVAGLTRRDLLIGAAGSTTLAGLTACDSSAGRSTRAASSPQGRSVDTVKGAITVPDHPARVVAGVYTIDNVLFDLGLTAVGTQNPGAEYVSPRYRTAWKKQQKVNSAGGGVTVEKIAALTPDLILGPDYPWMTDLYQQLSQIAPTVITPTTRWQDTVQTVAEAIGRVDELKRLKARYADRADRIKETYAQVLGRYRWDIIQGGFTAGQFWAYSPDGLAGQVLSDAGVQFAPTSKRATSSKKPGDGVLAISYEDISDLRDADVIGYYATYDGKPNNLAPKLFEQRLWKQLPAVKAGRLVPIPDFLVGGYGDAIACLDQLEAGLKRLRTR